MGADHSKSPTELRQYLVLLQQRNDAGQPFVIVGGHAANFWAEFYSEREPRLRTALPFTSKDLDVSQYLLLPAWRIRKPKARYNFAEAKVSFLAKPLALVR